MKRVASWLFVLLMLPSASFAATAEQRFATSILQDGFSSLSSDFDGDHKPDLLIGSQNGLEYTLEIRFSSRIPSALFSFSTGVAGLSITICDVNRDDAADLVVQASGSRFPSAVWLGDGRGHFVEGRPWDYLPLDMSGPGGVSPFAGPAQPVIALPDKRFSPDALIVVDRRADPLSFRLLLDGSDGRLAIRDFATAIPARSPPSLS